MLGGIDLTKKNQVISLIFITIISFAIFINCFTVKAENELEIAGPADAFEEEEIEFIVTLDGEPTQARVTFGDLSPAKYTNSSTGKVNFTMPSVPYEGEEYVVTASIPEELYAYHSILVKNKTGILEIELSTDYIVEMEEFIVTIKDRNEPVVDANVWFNSGVYLTDSNGNVSLTAPDVLVTTNYGLIVNKTGYTSNSTMITIHEAGLGLKLMEVINPSIVEPGEEDIEISVLSKNGGLENVTLEVYYEDSKHDEYTTDSNGKAYITSPLIDHNNYFSLYVSKDGYDAYSAEKEIKVTLFARDLGSDLEIKLVPSEVYEGEEVTVEVTDDVDIGVAGVSIWEGAVEIDETTDSEGISVFIAPSVFMDKEFYIYAVREGYNFAEGTITVRDRNDDQEKLYVDIENVVNESKVFYVTVKDSSNIPLQDVTVAFNLEEKLTDINGMVSFVAPNVTSDTFYPIEASKYGYLPATASIEVLNLDGSDGSSSKKLTVHVVKKILESEEFTITVKNDQGNLISDARVNFMDTYYYTDFKGEVAVTAPDVSWDETKDIVVTKSGYDSASAEITIKNSEEFQYWYLVIVIIVILIIGVVAYFRYGPII